jgi:hypothetical protein
MMLAGAAVYMFGYLGADIPGSPRSGPRGGVHMRLLVKSRRKRTGAL